MKPKQAPVVSGTDKYPETREKLRGIRRVIAEAMVRSKTPAPHVTLMDEVDVTEFVAHRKRYKPIAEEQGIKLTFLPYVVKALISAGKNIRFSTRPSMMKQKKLSINIITMLELQLIRKEV